MRIFEEEVLQGQNPPDQDFPEEHFRGVHAPQQFCEGRPLTVGGRGRGGVLESSGLRGSAMGLVFDNPGTLREVPWRTVGSHGRRVENQGCKNNELC